MTDIIQTTLGMLKHFISFIDKLKKGFKSRRTRDVEWRKQQLRQLKRGILEMKDELTGSLEIDLGKSKFVSEFTSLLPCIWDIDYSLENVEKVTFDDI